MTNDPLFLVVEGPDGVGKSTCAARLAARLDAVLLTEPTGGFLGTAARRAVVRSFTTTDDDEAALCRASAFGLFTADRLAHDRVIREHLDEGRTVILDRYALSTFVYQTSGLAPSIASALRLAFSAARTATLTLILDAKDDILLERLTRRTGKTDAVDKKTARNARLYRSFTRGLDKLEGSAFFIHPLVSGHFLPVDTNDKTEAELVDTLLPLLQTLPPYCPKVP